MSKNGVNIINSGKVQGFVKIEVYDKDGNKKVEKENLIVPGGKALMFRMSASDLLINGGNVWGLQAKQGVSFVSPRSTSSSALFRSTNRDSALVNVLANLTDEQIAGISNNTSFVKLFSDDFSTMDKVVAYAGVEVTPAETGKIGVPDYAKGSDIIANNINAVRYKYKDGVGTGTINAVIMAGYPTVQNPAGLACDYEQFAPGYRMAKCIDRVNFLDPNFTSFTTAYTPPGITGVTTDEEIITNYSINSLNYHKINLSTGEVTDLEDTNTLYGIITDSTVDYKIIDDYIYVLKVNSETSSSVVFKVEVYQISTATLATSFTLSSPYARNGRLLYLNDTLYITVGAYNDNASKILHKLSKGSNAYFSSVEETATTYAGILTIPAGLNEKYLSFGHYGDNYIMYVARGEGTSVKYGTGYIFTDITNIGGSIIDCIPSVRYTDIPFANASVGGVLSIGICTNKNALYDSVYNSTISVDPGTGSYTTQDMKDKGMFYTPDKSWSNIVSIVILTGDDVIIKGEQDVALITYGYRVV